MSVEKIEEFNYWNKSIAFMAGCDEVGRGPLAGPVVASCFSYNQSPEALETLVKELGVTDSKKLTRKKRLEILKNLEINIDQVNPGKKYEIDSSILKGLEFSLVEIQHDTIDNINILNASLKAMKESFLLLFKENKGVLMVDGNKSCLKKDYEDFVDEKTLVKGDQRSGLIALASILAKEYRDLLMEKYGKKYPGYGFESHAGYPTKKHKEAIQKLGVTQIHRKTFKGVKEHL